MNDVMSAQTDIAMTQAAENTKTLRSQRFANQQRARAAAQEFEAVFVAEMMKPMFEGISTDGMFGGGKGEEIFRGFMIQEYGKMMAQKNSIGIADQVQQQLIAIQEETQ